jgi:hypothetical protein
MHQASAPAFQGSGTDANVVPGLTAAGRLYEEGPLVN